MPLRAFGGASHSDIMAQRWLYAHFHPDAGATIGNYGSGVGVNPFRGVHIDAAGETAFATFAIPRDFHVLDECTLLYVNHNVGISSVTFGFNSKTCDEDLTTGEAGGAYDLPLVGGTTLRCFDLTGLIGTVVMVADDLFGISAQFGGDTAADVTLFGVIFKYH